MRALAVIVHRWVGLSIAGFLVLTGLTGAIIAWDHELDAWLNPHLLTTQGTGPARDALQLAEAVEARHPDVRVTWLPLQAESGHAWAFWVEPRVPAPGVAPAQPGFNQVFVDPFSGQELGQREWGGVWPITRENAVSFLYKLHYSLHLPAMGGSDRWGVWLLGAVALAWTIDCFTGLLIASPTRRAAWRVRWGSSRYKLNFDLHRAASLWTWALLLTLAFTAFAMNLHRELFMPMLSAISDVSPTPLDTLPVAAEPPAAAVTRRQAVQAATAEAQRQGWPAPAGSLFHSPWQGVYAIAFHAADADHGEGGAGHRQVFIDSATGAVLGQRTPWEGTAADLFVQAQYPLHSGRILGLPGRILVSVMGLVVAALSLTGVYIWWRKRRAVRVGRARQASQDKAAAQPA